jgi:hypothetical protein
MNIPAGEAKATACLSNDIAVVTSSNNKANK